MPQVLPRRIKLAFVLQALVGSIVITLGFVLAGLLVRQVVIERRVALEARVFWAGRSADPAFPLPRNAAMRGYLERPGEQLAELPDGVRGLEPGLHTVRMGELSAFVDRQPAGTLYVVFSPDLVEDAILWTALLAGLIALLTMYVLSWLTYRTSKRLVTPVSWLAGVVSRWDPRAPDIDAIAPAQLPRDAGSEVQHLSRALAGLGHRVTRFVQRERDFTRDASHELRTPLTVIRVATDLLQADPETSARAQRSLARVQRAGRDMESVIDAFLILAREADVAPLSEPFAVRDVIDEEVERVRPLLAGKPVELEVIDDGAPTLEAPSRVLHVMLGNLLGNAVRFTDSGRIELQVTADRIEIRDTGIGMSAETLERAFDPFFRADIGDPDAKGMGLSIVRRLGERFGWPVSLSSTPGQGTTAVIRFFH